MPEPSESKRNIEIKAKLADEEEFNEKVSIAKEITGESAAVVIVQHDVFFSVPNGRLKLRYEVSDARSVGSILLLKANISGRVR